MLLAAAQPPLHPSGAEPPAGYCWPGKAAVPRGAELPSPAAVTDVRQAEHRFPIALRPPARLKLGVRTDHRKLPESGTDIQKGTRRMKGGLVASWLKLTSGSFQKPGEKKENSVLPRLESPPSALRRPGSIPWRERRSCLGYYPERAAGNCWLKHRTVGSSDARSGPFVVCLRFRTSCARKKREITSSARASPHSSGTSKPAPSDESAASFNRKVPQRGEASLRYLRAEQRGPSRAGWSHRIPAGNVITVNVFPPEDRITRHHFTLPLSDFRIKL
ncbi:hypothetical protein FQA47_022283 [Oryzias melastigma]|uniref:Uncharacterized protein n=1 Tax=Oryzias melastigma TaxID=30732 RepID=A0A834KXL6_ORYME|nr:hypothetical protein FQA47_022283 [Oryzias melastigma]